MRPIRCAAGAVVLAIVVGCSDEARSGTANTSLGGTPSSEEAAPGTREGPSVGLSRERAAERYLAIVEPYNVALEGLEQALDEGLPLDIVRARAEATADANDAHIRDLRAAEWPADVQPHIDELVAESELAQPWWRRAAQAPTRDELVAAVLAAGDHDGSAPARTIRRLLGLEEYDEAD